jgi:hypothetical protein
MDEQPLDGLDVRAGGDSEARGGVPQLVRGQPWEAGVPCGGVEDQLAEVAGTEHPPSGEVNTRSSGDLPATWRASGSTRDDGTGTERRLERTAWARREGQDAVGLPDAEGSRRRP